MYVDFHCIQSVPPSCINRDDNGSPKSAIFGGVTRHRVSSQAWKKSIRDSFNTELPSELIGTRTKRIVELVAERIIELSPQLSDSAITLASDCFQAGGVKVAPPKKKGNPSDAPIVPESSYLFFLSNQQVDALAKLGIAAAETSESIDKKEAKAILKGMNSIDIALFGRMVADSPNLNVDAACQVAHSISTHRAVTEFDYFTAVDDVKARAQDEDAGAGMIGQIEFTSSTLYRYATINVTQLIENLGSKEVALIAIEAFARAFVTSMPTGKQNTFANRTLPEAVLIQTRDTQPVSYANAFEKPVKHSAESGFAELSVQALVAQARAIEHGFGLTPLSSFASTSIPHDAELFENLAKESTFSETLTLLNEDLANRILVTP